MLNLNNIECSLFLRHKFLCSLLHTVLVLLCGNGFSQSFTPQYTFPHTKNILVKQNGLYGLASPNNEILIPVQYQEVSDYRNGFARVVRQGKVGFVNRQGKEVIPCEYEPEPPETIVLGANMTIVYTADGTTQLVVSSETERMGFSEGLACVVRNGKYGFIDSSNRVVIPFVWEGADNFLEGMAIAIKSGKYGTINPKGETVIPFEYDLLVLYEYGNYSLYARKGKFCGIINYHQEILKTCDELLPVH